VVVHQVTRIPPSVNPRRYAEQFALNNRLRREGTRHLVEAARAAGVRRMVAQGVAFAYRTDGRRLKTEEDPLFVDAPDPFGDTIRALADLEETVLTAEAMEGMVLRYGYFYGPGTAFAPDGPTARRVRRRRFPVIGKGRGVFSFIHIDDAARATVLALDRGAPGVYNIVDDEPAELVDWLPEYAEALGAKSPGTAPLWVARLAAGSRAVALLSGGRGASNAKAKRELGWELAYPSWREGFPATVKGA
jgi:nucleoside-diphosphate-sugar epimerase